MEEKYVIEFDRYEKGTTINALNHLRSKLLEDGISTDSVDDIILKLMDAPVKKQKIVLNRLKGNYIRWDKMNNYKIEYYIF